MNDKQIDELIKLAHDTAEDEPDEALRIASNILNDNPNEPRALFLSGYIFMHSGRYGMAYNMNKLCAAVAPFREEAWNNLGMSCMKLNMIDQARNYLKKSLKVNKNSTAAINNMALIEVNEGNPDEAIKLANRSLSIDPNQWDVRETKGYANLMLGNWEEGWEGFEAMVGQTKQRTATPRRDVPYWDGSPIKTLHVRGEQGIGDEISFASIIPSVKSDVILECDQRLAGLFKRSFPNIRVYGTRFDRRVAWDDEFDAWCLSGSLGWHYRTKDSDFDGKPYLIADPERKLQWKTLLDTLGTKKKIGIAWSGGIVETNSARRSVALEQLLPILKQDATFISLQYKNPQAEIDAFEQKHGIKVHHWPRASEATNYDEVAALVDELDLIISVQTSVVHLAGALGKETWVLVPKKAHWRYFADRFPWCSSVEMFKQGKGWHEPIKVVSERLGAFLGRG